MRASVRVATGKPGPGRLTDVDLVDAEVRDGRLLMGRVEVSDEAAPLPAASDLRFDPGDGGGPLASPDRQMHARRFGVVNAAYHLHRGMCWAGELLGYALPPLRVRIGVHADQRPLWGGGHYRLPADRYSELPESEPVRPTGEIHLGTGRAYLPFEGAAYFDAPSHNPAIVLHELGHHICRHTADFRLNRRRPEDRQGNRKIPLDEGTSDFVAAVLWDCPDIFGWHRGAVAATHPGRRRLDVARTMADFRGGADQDPHADGTPWAAALWSARRRVRRLTGDATVFDAVVLHGLDRVGQSDRGVEWDEALRRRRHFARALEAILAVASDRDSAVVDTIAAAFAGHGIEPGFSNRQLRDRTRASASMPSGVS